MSNGKDEGRCVLGVEFSTQSAKWVVLDLATGAVERRGSLDYDRELPQYGTAGGVLPAEDPRVRQSPPAMFLDALDGVFARLGEEGTRLERIAAIKCDAQQHCTVYTGEGFDSALAELRRGEGQSGKSLAERIAPHLTRERSPIWEDRSTEHEARELEQELASRGGIRAITGNRAELRFPAAQIVRWARSNPAAFRRTAHIQLLSAFMSSVLAGRLAPVDTGDGWGTNLNTLDVERPGFSPAALESCAALIGSGVEAAELEAKVGGMVPYDTVVGTVAPYFARRYGVPEDAIVLAGTGDNPATLLGCGDGALVSLGTSYTVCGPMARIEPARDDSYNVFGYRPGLAMALSVITNGGKVHEQFRTEYAGGDWTRYAELAGTIEELSAEEPLLLPYLSDESVPLAPAGIVRHGLEEHDPAANVRALHVSQVASLKLHSRHLSDVDRLCVVGGGAANRLMRELIADAFGAQVYSIAYADVAAPFGCAVSGARAALGISYEAAVERFVRFSDEPPADPDPERSERFARIVERYAELEQSVVGGGA